jgi:arginine deiminase
LNIAYYIALLLIILPVTSITKTTDHYMAHNKKTVQVTSEIGRLRRLLVHSPDSGVGKVVPSKAQDWLFEDIVHLDTMRRKEYDYYTKVLLYFLDPQKIRGNLHHIDAPENNRDFYKPEKPEFYKSDKVIELEWLLAEILEDQQIRLKLIASV